MYKYPVIYCPCNQLNLIPDLSYLFHRFSIPDALGPALPSLVTAPYMEEVLTFSPSLSTLTPYVLSQEYTLEIWWISAFLAHVG